MSTFRVGQRNQVMIADAGNVNKERDLKAFDDNRDGIIDATEGARLYNYSKPGERPESMDDVFALVGGRQHNVKNYYQNSDNMWANGFKGNFEIPGLGAGNIQASRRNEVFQYNGPDNVVEADAYSIVVDCDLIDKSFLENNLKNATLIIGPRGFTPDDGSEFGEAVAVPLDIATRDGYSVYNRGGGSNWVPDKKVLGAKIDVPGLRELMGDSGGLSFYIKLESDKGTHFINRDGKAFSNFDIDASEIG
jgi:hypothetical protein